jgi:RimJ/RimL family protein N-acetyltransferase
MYGTRRVIISSLWDAGTCSYNSIWRELRHEVGYNRRFGNLSTPAMHAWLWDVIGVGNWRKFVISLDEDENIGVAAISLDKKNSVAFFVLGLLPQYRGKKFGTIAARLLLRRCFTEFGVRRVESSALSSNPASLNMQDWMIHEGTLSARFLIDGEQIDELLFRIMRAEWEDRIEQAKVVKSGARDSCI